jgi:MFS family permease
MVALDTSIICTSFLPKTMLSVQKPIGDSNPLASATAIPTVTTQFQSVPDIGWYSGAYLLPMMSLQPTFGKIYSYFNIKIVTILALLCFEVGSLICTLSFFFNLHPGSSHCRCLRCSYIWRRNVAHPAFGPVDSRLGLYVNFGKYV